MPRCVIQNDVRPRRVPQNYAKPPLRDCLEHMAIALYPPERIPIAGSRSACWRTSRLRPATTSGVLSAATTSPINAALAFGRRHRRLPPGAGGAGHCATTSALSPGGRRRRALDAVGPAWGGTSRITLRDRVELDASTCLAETVPRISFHEQKKWMLRRCSCGHPCGGAVEPSLPHLGRRARDRAGRVVPPQSVGPGAGAGASASRSRSGPGRSGALGAGLARLRLRRFAASVA